MENTYLNELDSFCRNFTIELSLLKIDLQNLKFFGLDANGTMIKVTFEEKKFTEMLDGFSEKDKVAIKNPFVLRNNDQTESDCPYSLKLLMNSSIEAGKGTYPMRGLPKLVLNPGFLFKDKTFIFLEIKFEPLSFSYWANINTNEKVQGQTSFKKRRIRLHLLVGSATMLNCAWVEVFGDKLPMLQFSDDFAELTHLKQLQQVKKTNLELKGKELSFKVRQEKNKLFPKITMYHAIQLKINSN